MPSRTLPSAESLPSQWPFTLGTSNEKSGAAVKTTFAHSSPIAPWSSESALQYPCCRHRTSRSAAPQSLPAAAIVPSHIRSTADGSAAATNVSRVKSSGWGPPPGLCSREPFGRHRSLPRTLHRRNLERQSRTIQVKFSAGDVHRSLIRASSVPLIAPVASTLMCSFTCSGPSIPA